MAAVVHVEDEHLQQLDELDTFLAGEEDSKSIAGITGQEEATPQQTTKLITAFRSEARADSISAAACVECRRAFAAARAAPPPNLNSSDPSPPPRLGSLVYTALLTAVTLGHGECLERMLRARKVKQEGERGGDSTDLLEEGEGGGGAGATLAHVATRRGDMACLHALLEWEPTLCARGDAKGATPLHVCAYQGHLGCLSYLLVKGAAADQRDQDGAGALHFAAVSGHLGCLKELVDVGNADPNEQTDSGETPVYYAAQEGHLDCVHWLVEMGGDPTIPSSDGMTPLHAAAQTGRFSVTHWLVRTASCSILCRTCDGATPIHFAAAKG